MRVRDSQVPWGSRSMRTTPHLSPSDALKGRLYGHSHFTDGELRPGGIK